MSPSLHNCSRPHRSSPSDHSSRCNSSQRVTTATSLTLSPSQLGLFDFVLSDDDLAELAALDKGRRFNDPGVFCEGMGGAVPIFD